MQSAPHQASVRHDGRLYEFTVPQLRAPTCEQCGERVFTDDADDQINDALRTHLGLLTPDEIASSIARLGMSQRDVAQRLGIAEETLSRWINDYQIQSRAMDNYMRCAFGLTTVPQLLGLDA